MSVNSTDAPVANGAPPLTGLRVVELTQDSFGAMVCGRMLAELGAEVVMAEPPEGHPYRRRDTLFDGVVAGTFAMSARGKCSLLVDLETTEGRAAFRALAGSADVVLLDIGGYRTLERLALTRELPNQSSLIVCCISPYGLSGPYRDVPGSELTVQALAGVVTANGGPDDEPIMAGIPVAAYGGAFYGLISILAALYERQRSGKGQLIDQSEFDAVASFQGTLIPGYFLTGQEFQRVGNRHTMTAPWNTYRTLDGWLVISTVGDQQWRSLAGAMGRPELADDDRFLRTTDRVRNVVALDADIQNWTVTLTTSEVLAALERLDVPASSVLTLAEALRDRQAVHRIVRTCEGTAMPRLPFHLERSASWRWGRIPSLGRAVPDWSEERFPVGHDDGAGGKGPLAGVRVLDIGILTAGPLAGRILGMLGADVVKVEPPGGERTRRVSNQIAGTGYLYHLNNTDKRGITVDASVPADLAALQALCASADVLLTNIGERSLAGMGLCPRQLRAANYRLITCAISGYGGSGPDRGRKAFDMVLQAQTGIMALTGAEDGEPTKVALSIVDVMSALSGVAGTIAALIARHRDGHGQTVDTSLLDVGVWMTQCHWQAVFERGEALRRSGNRAQYGAPHGCFRTADGTIALDVRNDAQWQAWLTLAGRADLFDDRRYRSGCDRVSRVGDVERLAASWARTGLTTDLVRSCNDAGIPAAPVIGLAAAVEHPLAAFRKLVVTVQSPSAGQIRVVGCPMKMSRSELGVKKAAPELGQDNVEIKNPVTALGGNMSRAGPVSASVDKPK